MIGRKKIAVSFHNFWGSFDAETSYFTRALRDRFDVKIVRTGADVEFYSVFGRNFPDDVLSSRALKVWFSCEAEDPRDLIYDLYFNFHDEPLLGRRAVRLPLWALYIDWWAPGSVLSIEHLLAPRHYTPRPKFCNFIYSNPVALRNEFFSRLDRLQHVDSFGKVLNNMGFRAGDKLKTIADYRFTIAFENVKSYGYVTEKLLEPLAAGSTPIYWGPPDSRTDFNPAAFIDATAFPSLDALAAHVIELDRNPDALRTIAEAPIFADAIPYEMTPSHFVDRIEEALDTPAMRGHGDLLNPQLASRRNLKGRLRAGFAKALRKLSV